MLTFSCFRDDSLISDLLSLIFLSLDYVGGLSNLRVRVTSPIS